MRGFEIVAIVIGVFFAMGVAVGMLLVIALPLLRALLWDRRNRRRDTDGGGNWWKQSSRNDDDRRPPRWPGG
jgi:membrane protein implicated in regulation of membrane protease activity